MGRFDKYLEEPAAAPATGGRFAKYLDAEPDATGIPLDLDKYQGSVVQDFKTGKQEPTKRIRSVLRDDVTGKDIVFEKAEDVAASSPKISQNEKDLMALGGGVLNAATLGLGDEAAAAISALQGEDYKAARTANRNMNKQTYADSPTYGIVGNVLGAGATAPILAAKAGLVANAIQGAKAGAVVGLGESEADLTSGKAEDARQAIVDTVKGGAIGGLVAGGISAAGKAVGHIAGAPARVEAREADAIIDNTTLGAPASMRDSLMGFRGQDRDLVLELSKRDPQYLAAIKAKDSAGATARLDVLRAEADRMVEAELARIGPTPSGSALDRLEDARVKALDIPTVANDKAAKGIQKQAELIRERYHPDPLPPPDVPPTAAQIEQEAFHNLTTGAKGNTGEKMGINREKFMKVAVKHDLVGVSGNPESLAPKVAQAKAETGAKISGVYDKVKKPMNIADFVAPLEKQAAELDRTFAGGGDEVRDLVNKIWEKGGGLKPKQGGGFERANPDVEGSFTMSAKKAREAVTWVQGQGFSGVYIDPKRVAEAQREAAGYLKDSLNKHIKDTAGEKTYKELMELNEDYSALIDLNVTARRNLAKARRALPKEPENTAPVPQSREKPGIIQARDLYKLATEASEESKRPLMSLIEEQAGPDALTRIQRAQKEQEVYSRMDKALSHKATREASPSTTARSHGARAKDALADASIATGAAATAFGSPMGIPGMIFGAALKKGSAARAGADTVMAAMVNAVKMGYTEPGVLRSIYRAAKMPVEIGEAMLKTALPQQAARE